MVGGAAHRCGASYQRISPVVVSYRPIRLSTGWVPFPLSSVGTGGTTGAYRRSADGSMTTRTDTVRYSPVVGFRISAICAPLIRANTTLRASGSAGRGSGDG